MLLGVVAIVLLGVFVPTMFSYMAVGHEPGMVFPAIAMGASAFSLMTLNIIIATRLPGINKLFSGLDRGYFVHKWIGISVAIAAYGHQYFKINSDGILVTATLNKLSVEVAEFVFWPLIILIAVSAIKRIPKTQVEIPWAVWRWGHRLLGLVFLALVFHQFFVKAPFDNNALLAIWLNFTAILGLAGLGWTALGPLLRKKNYTVSAVTEHDAATIVDLEPDGRGINATPGDFAFVSFGVAGLKEVHPFTISSVGQRGEIQFSIRGLGDYTKRLKHIVKRGHRAKVEGGYGAFHHIRGGDKQLWVGAGIGITPFLAWANDWSAQNSTQVQLVYCVRNEREAIGVDRFERAAKSDGNFSFQLYCSEDHGHIDAKKVIDMLPFEIEEASFWFCGPAPLRSALQKGFGAINRKPKSIHFERFEFR